MESDGVIITFRNVNSTTQSQLTNVFTDFEKLDFVHEKCENVEDTLNYNDGREANPFDKMGNYYGRHKDVFLFNRILRDKEMRVKIDELLSVKDDDIKTRFFTRMQLYLERLNVGEQEAKGFLEGPVAQAFYTGPRGVEKENLNLNLGKDGALRIGTVFDRKLDEMKRLKVHANGRKLMTVLKNGEQQKNYSFTKSTSCDMDIKWVASEKNCEVTVKVEAGGKLVKKAMVDGKQVKMEELIPFAKLNKGVLIRDKRLYQVLEECLQKGKFSDEKEEVEEESHEKLIIMQVPQVDNDAEVEEFFAEMENSLDVLKEQGVKDPLGKLRSDYGRNKNVFILKKILKDELLRKKMMNLVEEKLGEDEEMKLERKLDKMLEKFLQGEKLALKIVGDEDIDAFVAGGDTGSTNLNLNLSKNRTELEKLLKKAAASGVKRVKVFGGGQRLLTILKVGGKQRNYSFRDVASCELDISWKSGSENDSKTCQLVLCINSGKISASSTAVNGNPVALKYILELAKPNRELLISGKSLHLVLEKILEGGGADESFISMKCIGSQEKLTFHGSFKEQELLFDDPVYPDAVERFIQRLLALDFSEGAKPNAFNTLAKYYGREAEEDIFFFQTILRDPRMKERVISIIKNYKDPEEIQLQQFSKRMEIYLKRIENGEKDAKEFLGDGNAFFHGYHVAHPEHPRNIHENLNISLDKRTNPTFETGDNLFAKMIPRIVQEQSELRRVKIYGNGTRLATVLKLDGGKRDYTFGEEADCDLEVVWVVQEEDKECTLILNMKQGRITFKKGFLNGIEADKEKMIEFAKQNKIVFVNGKSLAEVLEEDEKTGDPDEKWEVLLDGNDN